MAPTPPDPQQLKVRRALTHFGRALLRRCPNCGSGGLFRRWLIMAPSCPGCHLKTDRGEPDYFIGAFTVNFVAAELLIVGVAAVWVWLSWPEVPWELIQWGLIALMIPAPILFYPFAKTIWLAIDLTFRPLTWADLQGHGENEGVEARPDNPDSPPADPPVDRAGVGG